ncbi:MAG: hypothetical protein Q4G27_01700 [Flavobacteriaceae bacterium]|nr:hypothetical protein [Flavobacteriaceae bacterium]
MLSKFWVVFIGFFIFIFPLFFSYSGEFNYSPIVSTSALALGFVLWILFILSFFRQTIYDPKRMKEKIIELMKNGHLERGKVLDKIILEKTKDSMNSTEIKVEFRNLSGTWVTHDFVFLDSKPYLNRYEVGNSIHLRLNTKENNPPVIFEESNPVFNPKFGIFAIIFLIIYMIGTFAAHYYFFSNGRGWRFLSFWHPWLMTPAIGLFIFVFLNEILDSYKFFSKGNIINDNEILLYGKPAKATIQRAEQTGLYVNEQPQLKFILNFEDDKGQKQSVNFKKIIPLTELYNYQKGVKDILFLPRDPQQMMFVDWDLKTENLT